MKYALTKGTFMYEPMPTAKISFYEVDGLIYYIVADAGKTKYGALCNENICNNYDFFGFYENKKVISRVKKKLKTALPRADVLVIYNELTPVIVTG